MHTTTCEQFHELIDFPSLLDETPWQWYHRLLPTMKNIWKNRIYYSQCWEDPRVLLEALQIKPTDNVLSVTSGACNTLALLRESPQSVTSVDINPAQNYLLEMKAAAIRRLDYHDFLKFAGVHESHDRLAMFARLKNDLSPDAASWWEGNQDIVRIGFIHAGKLEKFFRLFRRRVLPLIASRKKVTELFRCTSIAQQNEYFEKAWNTWRWNALFRIFFNRYFVRKLGRNPDLFHYSEIYPISRHYLEKTNRVLRRVAINDNYFMEYILLGRYSEQSRYPMYMQKESFELIKRRLPRLTVVTRDLTSYLAGRKTGFFSKFNLSDIFEPLSTAETGTLFKELVRAGESGSTLVYWNNLVSRTYPDNLKNRIQCDTVLEKRLTKRDRTSFLYSRLHVDRTQ